MNHAIHFGGGGGGDLDQITITPEDVRKGKIAVNSDGDAFEGKLESYNNWTKSGVAAGESVDIPAGIYVSGKVVTTSLKDQTPANAGAAQILSGYSGWVNGNKTNGNYAPDAAYGFSAWQHSNGKAIVTWSRPGGNKRWTGVVICYRTDREPSNCFDGTNFTTSSDISATNNVGITSGTVYFCAQSFIQLDPIGRIYSGATKFRCNMSLIQGNERFTYSRQWTVPSGVYSVECFLVGGGGGGSGTYDDDRSEASNGGGGGRTTRSSISVTPGETLQVVVGSGGETWVSGANNGGWSYIARSGNWLISAQGGDAGLEKDGSGSGGSGGGGRMAAYGDSGAGGKDGSDGGYSHYRRSSSGNLMGNPIYNGGTGQHSTTKDWNGTLYSTGGFGGNRDDGGMTSVSGKANTGDGGGGSGHDNGVGTSYGGAGGSGIVLIRWGY